MFICACVNNEIIYPNVYNFKAKFYLSLIKGSENGEILEMSGFCTSYAHF